MSERDECVNGLYMDDVWGKLSDLSEEGFSRITNGMIIARGLPYKEGSPEAIHIQNNSKDKPIPLTCPILKDKLPYKSVSVVCDYSDYNGVVYWLEYVHGGGCIQEEYRTSEDGRVFIRSDYQCW